MSRLIITFQTLHQVLSAEKMLKAAPLPFKFRPTPTPPGLTTSICGMSLEILDHHQKNEIIEYLRGQSLSPEGLHEIG